MYHDPRGDPVNGLSISKRIKRRVGPNGMVNGKDGSITMGSEWGLWGGRSNFE